MITSNVGQLLLTALNKHQSTSERDVRSYFEKEFVDLFFDHPNYLMPGGNSPLENPKFKKGYRPDAADRNQRIVKLFKKIADDPGGSSPIGFPSTDLEATTSGQVTNVPLPVNEEQVMLSWVGGGLGVGVEGGMSLLFQEPEILLTLEKGWHLYRELLNTLPGIAPNQVNSWNGQWLAHAYSRDYDEANPMAGFNPFSKEEARVETVSWVKLMLSLARKFPDKRLMAYVYNLGQTNTTFGFITIDLPKVRRPAELYRKLFGENEYLIHHQLIESLYGSEFGFRKVCQMGSVGVQALKPKGLRGLMPQGKGMPNYDKADETKRITYNTFISWIIAMLNNETLWEEAAKAADSLLAFEAGAGKAKKDRSNLVSQLLSASGQHKFMEHLVPIIEAAEAASGLEALAKHIHFMPKDNVPYFLTLVRFQYALKNKTVHSLN